MGFLDKIFSKEEVVEEQYPDDGQLCSVCGKPGADKSFGGQLFHKKCLRKTRKQAKRII